jgi:hypothetical protein
VPFWYGMAKLFSLWEWYFLNNWQPRISCLSILKWVLHLFVPFCQANGISCQLAFFGYPNWGLSVLFPQL